MNRILLQMSMVATLTGTLSACVKKSQSYLDARAQDSGTTIIKIPTPPEFASISGIGPYIPALQTMDYQKVTPTPIGYRILCTNRAERDAFFAGLGFTGNFDTLPSFDPDQVPEHIRALHLSDQPTLRCPADQTDPTEKPILVKSISNPPIYYVNYPSSTVVGRPDKFYEVGCEGILTGLGLNKDNASSSGLDRPNASKIDINCIAGQQVVFNPFIAECELAQRADQPNDDQQAYVTLLTELEGFTGRTCTDLYNHAKGLVDIDLSSKVLMSIRPLEFLTNLRNINVKDNLLASIQPLAKLNKIQTLDVSENPDLSDLSPLQNLKALKTLDISRTKVTDLTPLARLSKLTTPKVVGLKIDPSKCPTTDVASQELADYCASINVSDFTKACEDNAAAGATAPRAIFQALKQIYNKTTCRELNETLRTVTVLSLKNQEIVDVSGLQYLTQLEELDLSNNLITAPTGLASLKNLKKLNLASNLLTDVSSLALLNKLDALDLSNNRIVDLRAFANTPVFQGTGLAIQNNPIQLLPKFADWCRLTIATDVATAVSRIKDAAGAGDLCAAEASVLENVVELNLDRQNLVTLAPAGSLPGLKKLSARYNNISSIDFLETASKLELLDISYNQLTSISALAKTTSLKKLVLNGNQIVSLAPVRQLHDLETLEVSDNKIVLPVADVQGGFAKLSSLDLSMNKLTSIDALAYMPELHKVYLRKTDITDFAALHRLNKLAHVDVSENSLPGTSSLGELLNLQSLLAEKCSLSDINGLTSLNHLTILDLSGNSLQSVGAISQSTALMEKLKFLDLRENGGLTDNCPLPQGLCYK